MSDRRSGIVPVAVRTILQSPRSGDLMRNVLLPALAAGALLLSACGDARDSLTPAAPQFSSSDAPVIVDIAPSTGPATGGLAVTIIGTGFGASPSVTFGGNAATVLSATDVQIVATAPVGSGIVPVAVTSGGLAASGSPSFTYTPVIERISPATGNTMGGYQITIIGTGFGVGGRALFGGEERVASTATNTAIVFDAPAGQGMKPVQAQHPAGMRSNEAVFAYSPPQITSVSPTSGPSTGGTVITITGTNFGTSGTVTVGGLDAPPTASGFQHTSITVLTPPGLHGPQDVEVSVGGQYVVAPGAFSYELQPVIDHVTPSTGATSGGYTVTLHGSGFGTDGTVVFNGVHVSPTSWTASAVTFPAPPGQGANVPVAVHPTGAVVSSSAAFSYLPPAISSVSPSSAPSSGGTLITITGGNFGVTPMVFFDDVPAPLAEFSHTRIVAVARVGEPGTTVRLEVRAAGQGGTAAFHYDPPVITSLTPGTGPTQGGTLITITGTSLGASPGVVFNGVEAPIISASHTQVVVNSPAGDGSASVRVLSSAATSNALTFTYEAPTVTRIFPTSGPAAGGTVITIAGTNFGTAPTVQVGLAAAPVLTASHMLITAQVPPGTGIADVTVRTLSGLTAVLPNSFTYESLVCAAGSYATDAGCVPAPPGYYVPAPGATAALPCPAGMYSDVSGAIECIPAPPGFYAPHEAMSAPVPCVAGTFQPGTGAESCMFAEPGHFVSMPGAASQQPCSAGTVQPNTGAISCIMAPRGHYAPVPAMPAALPCAAGTYQPDIGAVSCLLADPGYFVATTAAIEQQACPAGTYSSEAGSTACTPAPIGFYVPGEGATAALACPEGTTTTSTGSTECTSVVQSPGEMVDDLLDTVGDLLADGTIASGDANALASMLNAARQQYSRDNVRAAENQLGAFINRVEAMVRARRISPAQGDALIAAARAIIAAGRGG
jgi:hypothetical protein